MIANVLTMGKLKFSYARLVQVLSLYLSGLWVRLMRKPVTAPHVSNVISVDLRLAAAIGLDEAVIVTRLLAWQRYNAAMDKRDTHLRDGKWYTYNSLEEWVDDFKGCFKATTLGRYLRKLESMNLVQCGQFLKRQGNMRKWYHVDEKALQLLTNPAANLETPSRQSDKMVVSNRHAESSKSLKHNAVPKRKDSLKHQQQPDAREAHDAEDGVSIPDSGDDHLLTTEGADNHAPLEANHYEHDAPQNTPAPGSDAPLPHEVLHLIEHEGLNPVTAREYVQKYGEAHAINVAKVVKNGKNVISPAGLWIRLLERGDYKDLRPGEYIKGIYSRIDDFVIR